MLKMSFYSGKHDYRLKKRRRTGEGRRHLHETCLQDVPLVAYIAPEAYQQHLATGVADQTWTGVLQQEGIMTTLVLDKNHKRSQKKGE